jgi:hypothetical protein
MIRFLAFFLCILTASVVHAVDITVNSRASLQAAITASNPGDNIIITDGVYTNFGTIIVPATEDGTTTNRKTLRAQTDGGVIFRGQGALNLVMRAAFWNVIGIVFENQTAFDAYGAAATGLGGLINFDGAQDILMDKVIPRNISGPGVPFPVLELNGTRPTRRILIRNMLADGYTQSGGRGSFIYIYGGLDRGFARDIQIADSIFRNRTVTGTTDLNFWIKFGDFSGTTDDSTAYESGLKITGNVFENDNPSGFGQDTMHLMGRGITVSNNKFVNMSQIRFRKGSNNVIANNEFINPNTSRSIAQISIQGTGHQIINNLCRTTTASTICLWLGKGTVDSGLGPPGPDFDVFADSILAHNVFDGFATAAIDMNGNQTGTNDGITTVFQTGILAHNNAFRQDAGSLWVGTSCASRFAAISHNGHFGDSSQGCISSGTNNVTFNPRWTNTASGDYTLMDNSPYVDAGLALTGYPIASADMFGNQRDTSPDIGIAEYGSQPPGPDACANIFGGVGNFLLCEQTATSCEFNVLLNNSDCSTLCGSFGKTCLGAINNGTNSCTPVLPNADTCDTPRIDQICICELDDPPAPPTANVRYVDKNCATDGNGTTTVCGPNGPWGGLNYALATAQCAGMAPGDIIYVRGNASASAAGGDWYDERFYVMNVTPPNSACSGVIVRPYPNEHVIIDGSFDIKGSTWTLVGGSTYQCTGGSCGSAAGTYPFTAWVSKGGTEYELDLIQSDRTCTASLAAGTMTYNPTSRRVCIRLADSSAPSTTTYIRIPIRESAMRFQDANVDNLVIEGDIGGTGSFWITRYMSQAMSMDPSINQGIRIDGIEISHNGSRGILVDGSEGAANYKFLNNHIHHIGQEGIRWRLDTGFVKIEDNIIHDIGTSPLFEQCDGVGSGCFPTATTPSSGIYVSNCLIAPEQGSVDTSTDTRSIKGNEIYTVDNGYSGTSHGIHLSDCAHDLIVDSNLIRDSSATVDFHGIKVSALSQSQHHNGNILRNNRCEDVDNCFTTEYLTIEQEYQTSNQFLGNTCLNPNTSCWRHIGEEDVGAFLTFENNLAAAYSGYAKLMDVPVSTMWNSNFRNNGFECTHADCVGVPLVTFQGTDFYRDGECVEGTSCIQDINPSLGNIYGHFLVQTGTLEIAEGSEAINAGVDNSRLPTDAFGNRRPFGQRTDIGAHEYSVEIEFSDMVQDGYRFFDVFSYNGKYPIAAENTPVTLYHRAKFVLRVAVYGSPDSSPGIANLALYAQRCSPSCGDFEAVLPLRCTGRVLCLVDDPTRENGEPIDNGLQLQGRTFLSASQYIDGEFNLSTHIKTFAVNANEHLELEYVLGAGTLITEGDTINIQVRNADGTVLSSYGSNIPSITIGPVIGRIEIRDL